MLRVLISTLLVLLTLICCANYGSKQISVKNSAQGKPAEILRTTAGEKFSIKNTKGVVVLDKFVKGDFVRFYNADGSLWYEFSYFYDDSDGKFDYANDDFRPFAFHVDYFLLALKCTENNDKVLEVVVNEETGLRKYVKANDPILKLETWEEFVLSVFSVNFDQKANPILEAPSGKVKKVAVRKVAIRKGASFRPVEIQGDWLKLRWDLAGEQTAKEKGDANGWIRWRIDETLLIDFYYFA